MATSAPVSLSTVRDAVSTLGLSGRCVCVHASLSSFGLVVGGAGTVVDGLLQEGCTVLVPTFSNFLATHPPPGRRLVRNACSESDQWSAQLDRRYTPEMNDVERGMGAIPAAVLATPGRARGAHPLNSFAAAGPMAAALVGDQAPLRVYAPLDALIEIGGEIVLMGVDLRRLTLLHLAEQRAGRTLFRRWAAGPGGRTVEAEIGGCSNGFERLAPALDPITREAAVGTSRWRVLPARAAADAATAAIRANPSITHCADAACEHCNDVLAGGPVPSGQAWPDGRGSFS